MAYRIGFDGRAPVAPVDNGSTVKSDPRLQLLSEPVGRRIITNITNVEATKNKAFNVEGEKNVGFLLAAASVALYVLGGMLIGLTLSTGVGAGVLAVGALLTLAALYVRKNVLAKEGVQEHVQTIHSDAAMRSLERDIQLTEHETAEAGRVGYAPRAVAPAAPARRI